MQELRAVLRASHRHGKLDPLEAKLDPLEAKLVARGLEFSEIEVGDLMRPLTDLVWVELDEPIEVVLRKIKEKPTTDEGDDDSCSSNHCSIHSIA